VITALLHDLCSHRFGSSHPIPGLPADEISWTCVYQIGLSLLRAGGHKDSLETHGPAED
jgi:hypothetical protein